MKARTKIAASLLLACYAKYATSGEPSCSALTASQEVFLCSVQERSRSDRALNNSYHDSLARVQSAYENDPTLGRELRMKIIASQRAWIKLRDANCSLESFGATQGSQAFETTLNNCIAKMSKERAAYLESVVGGI